MKTLICNCNQTIPLDAKALEAALGADAGPVHSLLCRREAAAFQRAAKSGDDLLVGCTQESRLFLELNAETEGAPGVEERPIRFVNLREQAGWSADARRDPRSVVPKLAALIAAAQQPEAEPVGTVTYRSAGRCLVVGPAAPALRAAALLRDKLDVHLLVTDARGAALPQERSLAIAAGQVTRIAGWLGAFEVSWASTNPIDLDLCTRCNACIAACPEGAIDFGYQIDLARCTGHRECVRVCNAAGAIDFQRAPLETEERFDLVIDLGGAPLFPQHQPPQGYFHATDDAALIDATLRLRELVGEFEKPKFFAYKPKLCAHSRNEREGCTACIDVCSARAVRSLRTEDGPNKGGIEVNPNLCVGCGACTTVCPSGALTYATPTPAHLGARLRTLLAAYARAGGPQLAGGAALLLHSGGAGAKLIGDLGRAAGLGTVAAGGGPARAARASLRGLPARVLPVEVFHTASVGLDLWLAAIAFGASQVWVLATDEEAPQYRDALRAQMAVGEAILNGLGYPGRHFRLIEAGRTAALDAALHEPAAPTVARPASFAVQADKRATLDLAIDHLIAQANLPVRIELVEVPAEASTSSARTQSIALPREGSPFGSLAIDTDACTLCLACVGACPENALGDNPERPQLRFTEKNCVQCGLCVVTCPESALALVPRLLVADAGKARKQPRVLHEVPPWLCVKCGKPFGTRKAIEGMLAKLAGHSMFQGAAADRLKMCGDCRVIDLYTNPAEVKITDL